MINTKAMEEIYKLGAIYETTWGKPVDFIGLPCNLSQEQFVLALRMIVKTGDSVLVGLQKVKAALNTYYDYLESIIDINDGDSVERKCPICGNKVVFHTCGNSYEFRCMTDICISYTVRGF